VRRIAIKSALVALGLVLAAFGAELAARALDVWGVSYYADVQTYLTQAVELPPGGAAPDNQLFQNKPNVALLDLQTFEYRTDARRLRTGRDRVPPAGAMPVLFLGDSVTLGWGVDDEETWVRRLERLARAPDGRPLECLNLGHLMYDTVQEAALLRAFGPELAPELVVLTFIYNDVHPTVDQLPGGNAAGAQTEPAAEIGPIGRVLDTLFPTLRKLARFRAERRRVATEDRRRFPPYSYYPSGWPRCAAALDDVKRTCAELGARLVVNDHVSPPMPEVAAWCARNGVPCLSTALSEDDQRRYRNSVIDSHLNAAGNAVVAEMVAERLVAIGVLAPAE
jgi:lysophospholipase L1-like esterase